MRKVPFFLFLCCITLAPAASRAATGPEWTLGFAMGTSEAIIRNGKGSDFNIYCPSGQIDTTPGISIEIKEKNARADSNALLEVGVRTGDYMHILVVKNSKPGAYSWQPNSDRSMAGLATLIKAIQEHPTFEVITGGVSTTFSSKGAKSALSEILDDCKTSDYGSIPDNEVREGSYKLLKKSEPEGNSQPGFQVNNETASDVRDFIRNNPNAFAVHLESYKNPSDLEPAMARLSKIPLISSGGTLYSHHVDLGKKGEWWRIMVGFFPDRKIATGYCGEIRKSNLDCVPMPVVAP